MFILNDFVNEELLKSCILEEDKTVCRDGGGNPCSRIFHHFKLPSFPEALNYLDFTNESNICSITYVCPISGKQKVANLAFQSAENTLWTCSVLFGATRNSV